METSLITNVLSSINGKVKASDLKVIEQALQNAPASAATEAAKVNLRSPGLTLLLSILMPWVGADRFYLGQKGLGIAKLVTCGGAGIWAILDLFLTMNKAKDINAEKILEAIKNAR